MPSGTWISVWRVGITLLIGLGSWGFLHIGLRSLEKHLNTAGVNQERSKRLATFIHFAYSLGLVLILLVVVLMIIHELGLNTAPILASAGVVGLAFSLGAQTVIKDFLAGIVIMSESHFTIGDVITVGPISGTVEHITLRATYLRDFDGKLHLIPNGDIRIISNSTSHWAQAVVTLNFDYEADKETVEQALDNVIERVQVDEHVAPAILESPYYLAWTGFTDWSAQAQLVCKTRPGQQWLVARVLRQAALEQLHSAGIRPAVPRQRFETVTG